MITPEGKVLVSADESHVVVELGRTTRLVAGTPGQKRFSGDGGPADLAQFDLPVHWRSMERATYLSLTISITEFDELMLKEAL